MDTSNNESDNIRTRLARERTRLAHVRTDFALSRTGVTIATFGSGVTELVGRNEWPGWMTDLLMVGFILAGMTMIQVSIIRSGKHIESMGITAEQSRISFYSSKVVPWLLQLLLILFMILLLLH